MNTPALINGRAYSYVDITAVGLGGNFPGLKSINYEQTQEKPNGFGAAQLPVNYGLGKRDSSGSMTLSMNDIEALRDAAPNGNLLDIPPFDFLIVFGNPQKPVTHVLQSLRFTNDGGNMSEDDTDIVFGLNFVFSDIKYR